jgi:hypothetical protein
MVLRQSERKRGFAGIEVFQSGLRILLSNTHAPRSLSANGVLNSEFDQFSNFSRSDFQPSPFPAAGNAVQDRVFHERLQDKLRNEDVSRVAVKLPTHLEPCSKAHLFDIEIGLDELDFLSQANQVRAAVMQCGTQ